MNGKYDFRDYKKLPAQADKQMLSQNFKQEKFSVYRQSIKRLLVFLLLLVFSSCATIDVSTLQETEIDKDSLPQLVNFASVKLSSVGVLVSSQTKAELAGAYGESFSSATEKLANGLGGVVVVTDHQDWDLWYIQKF